MTKSHVFLGLLALMLVISSASGATYIVNRTAPDDNTPGSLRWCMNSANFNAGAPDTILFQIPGMGPFTIFPDSQLPVLVDPAGVLIDGLSQTGSSAGANPPSTATLMIVINGSNAGPAHGIWIVCSNNTIQGLVINNFEQDGIRIEASVDGSNTNMIYCNFVGTDQTGNVAQGNGWNLNLFWAGIDIICTPANPGVAYGNDILNNLTSANYAQGVGISNCPPGDVAFNMVAYNYIGTDITGTVDLGNVHDGVYIGEGAHDNAVDANLISGNDFEGVCIVGYDELQIYTYSNILFNNIIGLDINLNPLGNTMDGVSIGQYGNMYQGGFATDNIIDSNTIACNGANGVTVWEHPMNTINADQNWIHQNSIYDNALLGIDLEDDLITQNDTNDTDADANQELNYPDINAAYYYGPTQITVDGTIDIDTDPTQATVEVFQADPDTFQVGEGRVYLGSTTPDAAGNWNITVSGLVIGDQVTATTTDMNLNTSEFSDIVPVVLSIEEGASQQPFAYALQQNVPNPFSSITAIHYALPKTTHVCLRVYDVTGELISTLVDGVQNASYHTAYWNGMDDYGSHVSSGIYFYTLEADDFKTTRKMLLAK